jgi:hypothetical protein
MASEQDDDRDRAQQLEALRRYMVRLDNQWEPPAQLGVVGERLSGELLGPAGRGRPSRRWLLLAGLLVALALVAGVVVGAVAWPDDSRAREATETTAGPAATTESPGVAAGAAVATPACKTAVDRANAMLASAVKLRGALAEQAQVLNDPANRELAVAEVLSRLAASQQVGSSESARFDRALDAYRQVVDQCDLQVP